MKILVSIAAFFLLGCNSSTTPNPVIRVDSIVTKRQPSIDSTQFHTTTDSVIIASKHFDTLVYSKKEFNEIVAHFPSLYDTIPLHPDISYAKSGYFKDSTGDDGNNISFGSEAGRDEYYILYAYFLKKKHDGKDLDDRRETLISIYQDINNLFGSLTYGGTFFGHQLDRIIAYAEYSIYQYKGSKDFFTRSPDIKEQKKIYLTSLRQIIIDEVKVDNEIPGKASKDKRQKELFKYVDHLDSLISDNFYLKKAQEFHYSNY